MTMTDELKKSSDYCQNAANYPTALWSVQSNISCEQAANGMKLCHGRLYIRLANKRINHVK